MTVGDGLQLELRPAKPEWSGLDQHQIVVSNSGGMSSSPEVALDVAIQSGPFVKLSKRRVAGCLTFLDTTSWKHAVVPAMPGATDH